jgi:hypothetical protein
MFIYSPGKGPITKKNSIFVLDKDICSRKIEKNDSSCVKVKQGFGDA